MANVLTTAILALCIAAITFTVSSWRKAYTTAKATNFPVFLSPVHLTDIWWLMIYRLLLPFLNRLPPKWKNPWLPMAQVFNIWSAGYKPFEEAGTDTFVLATPRGNLLWTCDPKVCNQLETLHPKSQVAVDMVKFFEVYGPTVGSVEGDEWKRHRRVIMTGFDPSTNATVWRETTRQTQALIERWSEDGNTVSIMKHWTSRLALHVISAVFFDKHLTWNDNSKVENAVSHGHELPFDKAIFQVIESLGILFVTPRALLGILPMEGVRKAHLSFTEWTKYLQELRGDTIDRVEEISAKKSKTIVESIVLAAMTGDRPLPEDSILGNIFFTLLAGHETVGNTLAFAFDILALYPGVQSKIHEELDGLLAERPQEAWTVEREYQKLQKGWIGAVIKEILRLYVPTQWIPRQIVEPVNVADSNGTTHALPKGTLCLLDFAAAFRDPKIWPPKVLPDGRREALHNSPALDFDPSQWLGTGVVGADSEDAVPRHFPFGQGPHVCPGRLFAQVEMVAALATVLAQHSLELVVSEETLKGCGGNEMAAREQTRDHAFRRLIDDVEFNVSLQLLKELPIRLVERV